MRPNQTERQEFEYIRHGTVNFLAALMVHSGKMRGWCLERKNSEHMRAVLRELFRHYRAARRMHLIWDGDSSHTSAATRLFLKDYQPWVRVLVTPAHASWLNQAELLLRSFSARYLDRGEWASKQHMMDHLNASWPGYNRLFAHPFTWSWTRRNMRQWIERHKRLSEII